MHSTQRVTFCIAMNLLYYLCLLGTSKYEVCNLVIMAADRFFWKCPHYCSVRGHEEFHTGICCHSLIDKN